MITLSDIARVFRMPMLMPSLVATNPQVTVTTAALSTHDQKMELKQAQEQDSIVKHVRQALLNSPLPPKMPLWLQPSLHRYRQL